MSNMTNFIPFIVIGTAAGILGGFFGIAGGIVIIPALVFVCGFDQLTAQGTSLAVLLPPVGILGFIEYYKHGNVNIPAAVIICITLFVGAYFGAKLAQFVPAQVLRKGFAVFLILVSIKLLFSK